MTTEFTRLNNSIITLIMKTLGFRKIGKYEYGATFDKAVYQRLETECHVTFSIHPSDYPLCGLHFEKRSPGKLTFEKQYLLEDCDLESLFNTLASDLEEGEIVP